MTTDVKAARRRRTTLFTAIAAVAVVAVAAVAVYLLGIGTLRWSDPAGAKACAMLSDALDNGRPTLKHSADIGDIAKDSTTPAIKAAVSVDPSRGADLDALALLDELREACVASGIDMPAYPD